MKKRPKTESADAGPKQATSATPRRRASLWKLFAIDPRSLAVFRVAIGLLLLGDLAVRSGDVPAMYTDAGIFPRAAITQSVSTVWNWSFHFASGDAGSQWMLFGLAAALALALAAGFETRLAAIGSWLMLVSIQHRVPMVLSGADILLRMLLFWAMFLPLGRVWSADAWRARGAGMEGANNPPGAILSIASIAILSQMAMMYLLSAMFKTNADWIKGGVIAQTLAHDFYAKPLGESLLRFEPVLGAATWAVFLLEWLGPVLLFWPRRNARTRLAGIGLLAALHIGIGLTLNVDLFSPVALAGLALFLPPEFWNKLQWIPQGSIPAVGTESFRERSPWGYLAQGACLLALIFVVLTNLGTLARGAPPKPGFLRTACGLGQRWNMFDEAPSKDGWYVARAQLWNGREIDLLRDGAPLSWDRPDAPAALYPNFRWRKLFREMAYEDELGYQYFRTPAAEHLCREWNARHPREEQIAEFDLVYCIEQGGEGGAGSDVRIIVRDRLLHLDRTGS